MAGSDPGHPSEAPAADWCVRQPWYTDGFLGYRRD